MNNIIDIHAFEVEHLSINSKEIKPNSYHIQLFYKNFPFSFQGPLCKIENIEYNDKNNLKNITVSFNNKNDFKTHAFLNIFDIQVKTLIDNFLHDNHLKSGTYYPGHKEIETNKYVKIIIKLKVNNETKYFDQNKKNISEYELKINDSVVFLFHTKGVFFDKKSINYRWTAFQILKLNI